MKPPFKIVVKARSREGAFHVLISATVAIVAASFPIVPAIYGEPLPVFINAPLALLAVIGFCYLVRALLEVLRNHEWEISVHDDRLEWIARDDRGEKLEGEIRVNDIRALVYRPGDGGASLEIEFLDGTVKPLPLVGAPSESALRAFIDHWREAHAEIPIRNLENA